jgi:hypothetical protein
MPFTISHAGFVIPFRSLVSPNLLCGLMIGSVVPDFGYFIREFGVATFAHTILGALCISLPLGLAVYFLLCFSLAGVARVFPKPHSRFLLGWRVDRPVGLRELIAITSAILVGALSHNFVDSFTHQSGTAVSLFPALEKGIVLLGGDPIPVFRILQYAGSLFGLLLLVAAYGLGLGRFCRETGERIWQDSQRWQRLIGIVGSTSAVAAAWNADDFPRSLDLDAMRGFGFQFLITWLPILGATILCMALFWRLLGEARDGV